MVLVVLFAGLSLFLAAAGIYGVLAFIVTSRTREMGVRLALGARPQDLRRLVVGYGLRLCGIGLLLGALPVFFVARFYSQYFYGFQPSDAHQRAVASPYAQTQGLLYGVHLSDPTILLSVPFVLLLVTTLACYIPARRATRVDPLVALRSD
jgi:putative ABC transport system permease protein